tara:strand:- start:756 stop:932 length:177 start_codon:yes stop_codon:yes gene_type:complete
MPHFIGSVGKPSFAEKRMQTIQRSYRGLSLLMELNWDRALYTGTIVIALAAGTLLGSM